LAVRQSRGGGLPRENAIVASFGCDQGRDRKELGLER
jgi:hypothetical protein